LFRPTLLALLAIGTPFAAFPGRALGQAEVPPAPASDEDQPPEPELPPSPASPPVPTESATRFAGVDVEGSVDPPGRVEALVATVAPPGSPFVPSGEADRIGTPIATIPRIRRVLSLVGYSAKITEHRGTDGVRLQLALRPLDRVRRIFVSGNQSGFRYVRQQEIIGKLSIRPGQKLPPAGPRRDAFLATETDHVREFLRSSGYWEAEVALELHDNGRVPAEINLLVRVRLGPAYPLGPLTVTGATALAQEDILEGFRHRDWHTLWILHQPFRRTTLRDDIASLIQRYRRIGFPGVRVRDDFDPETSLDRTDKQVRLGIDIRERKHIEVAFEGNRSRSAGKLEGVLTLLQHGAYDDVEAEASAAALAHDYRARGHMLVKVTWRRERLSDQSDRLVFVIDEGPVLKVRRIAFEGNRAISSDVLAERIRTRVYPFLGLIGLGEGGFASPKQLELDVQSLVEHYAAVGYPETKVRAEIAPRPGPWRPLTALVDPDEETVWRQADSLYIRFLIEESPLVWVGGMQFLCESADETLPREDDFYMELLRTVIGAPYQPALIKRDENRLTRALGDDGYRYAQVEGQSVRHGNVVHVIWKVNLGPQVRVGPIFLRGNFLTTDRTILTWAELRTGDVLTTRGLERAQRNLALIQLFNNPNPLTFPTSGRSEPVLPMLVEVEERHDHWGVIRVGGGAATDQATPGSSFPLGVYGTLGYEHRNLFGHGWTLSALAAWGPSLTSASSTFLNRRFLGTLLRMDISASYLRQATIRLGDLHSGSGSFGFAREMFPGVEANIHYNLRNTSRTELLVRRAEPGPFLDQTTVRIGTFVSSLSTAVEWQRVDHVLVPTRGFKVGTGVEVALPAFFFNVGEDSFIKFFARGLSVVPILPWLSLRYSIRYDQGFPLGGAAVLPKVERFFAGGDTTIRGYQVDRALTETIAAPAVAPAAGYASYRPAGGNLRVLQNIDLQFPLSPPLYGGLFLDSGVVGYSWDAIVASDFRHGVGVSPLVIRLPVGDVSLSFAIPLNRHPGDDTWRTHFNVGLMF
jgi:outer membrane protein insertion porin family